MSTTGIPYHITITISIYPRTPFSQPLPSFILGESLLRHSSFHPLLLGNVSEPAQSGSSLKEDMNAETPVESPPNPQPQQQTYAQPIQNSSFQPHPTAGNAKATSDEDREKSIIKAQQLQQPEQLVSRDIQALRQKYANMFDHIQARSIEMNSIASVRCYHLRHYSTSP